MKEKELTHARDAMAAARRRMPWLAVEKEYQSSKVRKGKRSLPRSLRWPPPAPRLRAFFDADVYGWPDHACVGCSLGADQVSHLAHLHARDTTLVYATRLAGKHRAP